MGKLAKILAKITIFLNSEAIWESGLEQGFGHAHFCIPAQMFLDFTPEAQGALKSHYRHTGYIDARDIDQFT